MLGHHVLRGPRPLPLHERGLRPVRPRQRAPAGHVPERHQVRGRDHRHDPRPPPRRGGHRRRAGRAGGHRRHRQHLPRHAGLPRARRPGPRHPPAQRDQAGDRPSGLRQGLPSLRDRAAGGPGRPGHHPGRHRVGRPEHRRRHRGHHRLGLQLRLRDHRPDRDPLRHRPAPRASGSTSTAAWVGSSSPSARSSATTSRSSTTASPG